MVASAHSLAAAFAGTRYLRVTHFAAMTAREVADQLVSGDLRGYVVIPQDFEQRLAQRGSEPLVQIVTDGSYPNTANYVENYARGVVQSWRAGLDVGAPAQAVMLEPRYWFNPELESRRALIPGAIAIVMTIIGTMLTALVVAREWERGTMEAVLSTPASVAEILIGKLLPYFVLGMLSTLGAAAAGGVRVRGPDAGLAGGAAAAVGGVHGAGAGSGSADFLLGTQPVPGSADRAVHGLPAGFHAVGLSVSRSTPCRRPIRAITYGWFRRVTSSIR
jgi:ABC-2 type transport system permease protein